MLDNKESRGMLRRDEVIRVIMSSNSRKISCSQMIVEALAVRVILWIYNCGDFFAESQTKEILNETVICSF